MLQLPDFMSIDTTHLWLNISQVEQQKALRQAQRYSNPTARYNAYLNSVCLYQFLNWLQDWLREEYNLTACVFPSEPHLANIWEFVSGAAIQFDRTRLVLIPTETLDLDCLCVPQEWVDIKSWKADYYVAVQVNLDDDDDCWMRVCGFTTHRQLKNKGTYNQGDRTYSLPMEALAENIISLFATLGLNLQVEVPSVVSLSQAKANDLLNILGSALVYNPRLFNIPFTQWAALISNEEWCQQLYNKRLGIVKNITVPPSVNLSQWFENLFQSGWQTVEALLKTQTINLDLSTRSSEMSREIYDNSAFSVTGAKLIDLGIQLADHQVVLIVKIVPKTEIEVDIRLRVYPGSGQIHLPPSLQLMVWDETGNSLKAEARSIDNWIQVEFSGEKGEHFSAKVVLADVSVTEEFVI